MIQRSSEINQGSTSELCPSSWNLVHRSPFSSKAWMSFAASLISLRSTCLCWVIPLTLRTLRARSLFTTGASSQSRSCEGVKEQYRSRQRALKRSNGVFICLSNSETKQHNSFHYKNNETDNHSLSYAREYSAGSSKPPLCLRHGQRSPSNACKTCGHAERTVTLLRSHQRCKNHHENLTQQRFFK